jgi:hypothetical protein
MVLILLGLSGLISILLNRKIVTLKQEVTLSFYWIGVLYGISQQLFLHLLQKFFGLPDWGLSICLSFCLLTSIAVLGFYDKIRLNRAVLSVLFALLGACCLVKSEAVFAFVLISVIILQSLIFTTNLKFKSENFRLIWWSNGLGFVLGTCLYYVVFSMWGFQVTITALAVSYIALTFLSVKNKNPAF